MKKFVRKYLTPMLKYLIPPLVWLWLQFIRLFSRFEYHGIEHRKELDQNSQAYIIAFWHNRQFVLPFIPNTRPMHCLISSSRDGSIATAIMRLFKMTAIRGSSSKDGMQAMMTMMRVLRSGGAVALPPDGPRGPAFVTKPGIVQMAQSLNIPILPMSFDNNRKKVLSSWDSSYLPRPFGKINIVIGEAIRIHAEEDIDTACVRVTDALNAAGEQAKELTIS